MMPKQQAVEADRKATGLDGVRYALVSIDSADCERGLCDKCELTDSIVSSWWRCILLCQKIDQCGPQRTLRSRHEEKGAAGTDGS